MLAWPSTSFEDQGSRQTSSSSGYGGRELQSSTFKPSFEAWPWPLANTRELQRSRPLQSSRPPWPIVLEAWLEPRSLKPVDSRVSTDESCRRSR
ncbi:hypothetical protein NL676_039124 [Syzygium grande]|nr:hypothetical protein NL676_039124 [Syzygium grande]